MPDIYEPNNLIGDAVNPYQQQYSDTCAIKSQQIIMNEFGIPATEDQLVQYSYEHGWYQGDGSGTSFEDVGNLLEEAGIPCTRQADANVFNLVNELAQGHKVIVGVDSGELWGNRFIEWLRDFFLGDTPDHALIVTGIDTSDPDNIRVIVTDPGSGDYQKSYPLDQFMDAWSDAQCYMVSTDVAIPSSVPEMSNFDYETGHIDQVAGMDYEDFQIFNDISAGIPVYEPLAGGTFNYPMSSLMDAYFDVAHNDVMFNQIFADDYGFNQYLDLNSINQAMMGTYTTGLEQINFTPDMSWDTYAMSHGYDMMQNDLYGNFLHDSIDYFNTMGDFNSAMLCEQQMMMLDYCDGNNLDFYSTFYSI